MSADVRTVLLAGSDACFLRMLTYELTRAGYAVVGEWEHPDCALVDLDSAPLPDALPTVAYTRKNTPAPPDLPVLRRPFAIETLLDALAQLERLDPAESTVPGGLRLDEATHTVTQADVRLTLMPAEYAILRCLLEADGEPVSRRALIDAMPSGTTPTSNLAEVVVCTLRRKLEAGFGIRPIRTVRGIGYRYAL